MTLSATMKTAWDCLGGAKRWRGCVRGLFGLISREFDISSIGVLDCGVLRFSEHMTFSDGVEIKRQWEILDTGDGLDLKADKIRLLEAGTIQDGGLVYEYALKLGAVPCRYIDRFRARPDGRVENIGIARFMGIPVLRVEAVAEPLSIKESAVPTCAEPALAAQT